MMVGLAIGAALPPGHPSGSISAIPDRRVLLLAVALWQDRSVRLDAIE
jgi:hypothetical protein